MNYTKISLTSKGISPEIISAIYQEIGFAGVQIEEKSIKDEYVANDPSVIIDWSKINLPDNYESTVVSGFWPDAESVNAENTKKLLIEKIEQLKNFGISIGDYQIKQEIIAEEDWSNNWKPYFHPIQITDSLYIVPTWENDSFELPDNAKKIVLDPGMAFGTGGHPTTIIALRLIEKYLKAEQNVIDLGTGSGILTIAASLLGAKNIIGTDIDQNSVNVAKENLLENNVTNAELVVSNLFSNIENIKVDLIVANILPDVLLQLIPESGLYLKDQGLIILGGINQAAVERVSNSLIENKYQIIDTLELDGWFGLVGSK